MRHVTCPLHSHRRLPSEARGLGRGDDLPAPGLWPQSHPAGVTGPYKPMWGWGALGGGWPPRIPQLAALCAAEDRAEPGGVGGGLGHRGPDLALRTRQLPGPLGPAGRAGRWAVRPEGLGRPGFPPPWPCGTPGRPRTRPEDARASPAAARQRAVSVSGGQARPLRFSKVRGPVETTLPGSPSAEADCPPPAGPASAPESHPPPPGPDSPGAGMGGEEC